MVKGRSWVVLRPMGSRWVWTIVTLRCKDQSVKTNDYHGHLGLWKELLRTGLAEDGWQWDWTTLGTLSVAKDLKARVVAKSTGVWAGASLVPALNSLAAELGAAAPLVKSRLSDGDRFKPGQILCEW